MGQRLRFVHYVHMYDVVARRLTLFDMSFDQKRPTTSGRDKGDDGPPPAQKWLATSAAVGRRAGSRSTQRCSSSRVARPPRTLGGTCSCVCAPPRDVWLSRLSAIGLSPLRISQRTTPNEYTCGRVRARQRANQPTRTRGAHACSTARAARGGQRRGAEACALLGRGGLHSRTHIRREANAFV